MLHVVLVNLVLCVESARECDGVKVLWLCWSAGTVMNPFL